MRPTFPATPRTASSTERGSWNAVRHALPEVADATDRTVAWRDLRVVPAPVGAWNHPPAPVAALVFPRFVAGAGPVAVRVDPMRALVRLLDDRVFLGQPLTDASVAAFLAWLATVPAHDLTYPDLPSAEAMVRRILA